MDFKELVQKRRSVRKYTEQQLSPEQTQIILRAALMAPTSKSTRAWHFIVVDDTICFSFGSLSIYRSNRKGKDSTHSLSYLRVVFVV